MASDRHHKVSYNLAGLQTRLSHFKSIGDNASSSRNQRSNYTKLSLWKRIQSSKTRKKSQTNSLSKSRTFLIRWSQFNRLIYHLISTMQRIWNQSIKWKCKKELAVLSRSKWLRKIIPSKPISSSLVMEKVVWVFLPVIKAQSDLQTSTFPWSSLKNLLICLRRAIDKLLRRNWVRCLSKLLQSCKTLVVSN